MIKKFVNWFKKAFSLGYMLVGNVIQVFIFAILALFLMRHFSDWMVDMYVLTNCNQTVFHAMSIVLFIAMSVVCTCALLRFAWFRVLYPLERKRREN
ncbi:MULTISPECIES: hypothetical protein [unclassified Ligilactobacillus]|uniref:hypothetical protein n=1 Tax=unclassified Ligilactobacillus TaxID=2767920 RepID=UPI003854D6F1